MKNRLMKMYKKYEEYVNYFIVGVCTTIVSLSTKYLLLFTIFDSKNPFQLQLAVVISWFISVSFAYVTNRRFVFKSKEKNILKEILIFFGGRVSTLGAESLILWFFITLLGLNSNLYVIVWTLFSQIIIFIGNYLLSKYFVFNDNNKKIFTSKNAFYILLFVLLFVLCYFFPYTHDDWAWGSQIGIDRLTSLFKDYNGRWLGNIFIILMTRNRLLKTIIMSGVLSGIVIYIKKILNLKYNISKLLTILLLILMPVSVLAQAVAWTSGFTNYVIVVLLILVYLNYNKEVLLENKRELSNKYIIPYFILGICASLFIEHVTIYSVLVSIFFVLAVKIKNKKFSKINISYMIGAIIGAVVMFSNGAYHNIVNNQDGYRQISQDNFILSAIKTYFLKICNNLFIENHFITIFVGIVCLFLIYKYLKNNSRIKKLYRYLLLCFSIFISSVLTFDIYNLVLNELIIKNAYYKLIVSLIYSFYWVIIFALVLYLVKDKKVIKRLIFTFVSFVLMAGPLLVVKPVGPRCFFPIYVFFVIFAVDLFNYVFDDEMKKLELSSMIIRYFIVLFMFINLFIYGICFLVETKRNLYINNNQELDSLVVPMIPFEEYMQVPNPTGSTFMKRFKLFYDIDEEKSLIFVPYSSWK